MGVLADKLLAPGARSKVLDDCVQVIEEEVASKGGLTGLAIKGGYKVVKSVSPGIIRESMDNLLNDFTARLEPTYEDFLKTGNGASLRSFMGAKSASVANALLGITDDRAKRASGTIKKAYEQLRPTGQKHVEEAVPRIADLLAKYTK